VFCLELALEFGGPAAVATSVAALFGMDRLIRGDSRRTNENLESTKTEIAGRLNQLTGEIKTIGDKLDKTNSNIEVLRKKLN